MEVPYDASVERSTAAAADRKSEPPGRLGLRCASDPGLIAREPSRAVATRAAARDGSRLNRSVSRASVRYSSPAAGRAFSAARPARSASVCRMDILEAA